MRLLVPVIYLVSMCSAADQPCESLIPRNEEPVFHPHHLQDSPLTKQQEVKSEELSAHAVGSFFASERFNVVENIFYSEKPEDCSRLVNYGKFLVTFSELDEQHSKFIEQRLDKRYLEELFLLSNGIEGCSHGTFDVLRIHVAKAAKDEFAIIAFDVAILKWAAQAIEKKDNSNIFQCSYFKLSFHLPLLGLELVPKIGSLCRRELDVLIEEIVAYHQKPKSIEPTYFARILNIIIALNKECVTEKLMPILMENELDPKYIPRLLRYVQLLSPSTLTSKLLKKAQFQNQPGPFNQFDIKLFVDHDPYDKIVWITPLECPLKKKIEREYVLQGEIVNGEISWISNDFVYNREVTEIVTPNSEHPHQLYVVSPIKPPPSFAAMLVKECQTEVGLEELLKSPKFRFATMAFRVTMFEASSIQKHS